MPKHTYSSKNKILQELLRQIRIESGMSQSELAAKLKQPQSFISKYENGERRLDLIEVEQICDATGTTLMDLIDRYEDMTSDC